MILYNVTVNVDEDVEQQWLAYMKDIHIPDVMRTGMFISHKMFKLLQQEEMGGTTYSVQYFAEHLGYLETYLERYAPALREDVDIRFKNKYVAFRTVLEAV